MSNTDSDAGRLPGDGPLDERWVNVYASIQPAWLEDHIDFLISVKYSGLVVFSRYSAHKDFVAQIGVGPILTEMEEKIDQRLEKIDALSSYGGRLEIDGN